MTEGQKEQKGPKEQQTQAVSQNQPGSTGEGITIIEKNIHRTNLRRLIDTLYLFIPIVLAFSGCFLAEPVWKIISKNSSQVPELFRFACALILFGLSAGFVFIKTRKINPIMKIGIFSSKKD